MSKAIRLTLAVTLLMFAGMNVKAQEVGLKTNLLYDAAAATANAGIEIGLAPKWTMDLSGNFIGWRIHEQTWKHWMVQPEARYWFCDRFAGHFLGIHAIGGQFNWGNWRHGRDFLGTHFSALKDYRAQGWGVGGGIAYGYTWVLGKHWNFEAEVGVGVIQTWYDVYDCETCASRVAVDRTHTYYGPTKAALNLVYVF